MDFTNLDKKFNEVKKKMQELEACSLHFELKNYKNVDEADAKIKEAVNQFNYSHKILLEEIEFLLEDIIKHLNNCNNSVMN